MHCALLNHEIGKITVKFIFGILSQLQMLQFNDDISGEKFLRVEIVSLILHVDEKSKIKPNLCK